MAKRLNIDALLHSPAQYPIERILVDTNVVINHKNPFGYVSPAFNSKVTKVVNRLQKQFPLNATLMTASEYFRYLQVGYYNIFVKTHKVKFQKYSAGQFKRLRKNNGEFARGWDLRLRSFRLTFTQLFPPFHPAASIFNEAVLEEFDGAQVDFGDEMFYQIALQTGFPVILTTDRDFASFRNDLNIILI